MTVNLRQALSILPPTLLDSFVNEYEQALAASQNRNWEIVGLKAGKLCEIIYSIVNGHIAGHFPEKPAKPRNMVEACQALADASTTKFSRSIRIQIPRILIAVYELRNNRNVGHVGGSVNPNDMDGEFFLRAIKWLVAEVVREFANIDI